MTSLFNNIIYIGRVPDDWHLSYIIYHNKGKGDAFSSGNYRGLKLQEHVMKILKHIFSTIIQEQVSINNMQFGFMPGRGTNDVIFILRQLQEKCLQKKKNIYFAFVDLERAFDRVPDDLSYIINLFKGKGDALSCGNYRGFKLQEHVMKILKHILNTIIREQVSINNMQFGFMPGRGTTEAIFILKKLQEKYLQKKKNIFAFVDLEKAFNRVPRRILWWAMQKLEWIIQIVKSIYNNASRARFVRFTNSYRNPINVSVELHQGSVLSPLLFKIVMEALSCEFRTGCPWELLYADDFAIVAESLGEQKLKLKNWKNGLEEKGLKVNVGKTKFL